MLKDQDRIFTNIYGMHERTLRGAQARQAVAVRARAFCVLR